MKENYILLHNASPNTKVVMVNNNVLNYDDYVEVEMKARFEKRLSNIDNKESNDRLNAFLIQFVPKIKPEVSTNKKNDEILLSGLVISLISHDSDDNLKVNQQTHFLTYRFFPQQIKSSRDYFEHLFERRDKHDGCYLDTMSQVTDFRFTIDFEESDTLILEYKRGDDVEWNECFSISNISRYITRTQSFIQIQQSSGKRYTMRTELYGFNVQEKHHRLDVDSTLHVSHDLVEEIFDKMQNFGKIFEEDKENLGTIQELQSKLLEKSQMLQIYARDLNRGSRKFQEYMVESLNKHRMINPVTLPKMQVIKGKIDRLQARQNEIFQRFANIKNLINSKNIIKESYRNFKKMDKILELTIKEISSEEFKTFIGKTKSMIQLLKNVNFENYIDDIRNVAKNQAEEAASTSNKSILIIIGICIGVFAFSWLIIRSIGNAEKSHYV